mgnify:CR=1 FL=1
MYRETQVHITIQHNHVVRLFNAFEKGQKLYMVLEFLEGGTLLDLKRRGLGIEAILRLFAQTVGGILSLHERGLVHRDLKLENVLTDSMGIAKVADLGFAAPVGDAFVRATFCGTRDYLAPEILLGLHQTERVDIWCLGILLYELTHSAPPFRNQNIMAKINDMKNHRYVLLPSIDPQIAGIISACLQFVPKLRPSAAQLLSHPLLQRALSNSTRSTSLTPGPTNLRPVNPPAFPAPSRLVLPQTSRDPASRPVSPGPARPLGQFATPGHSPAPLSARTGPTANVFFTPDDQAVNHSKVTRANSISPLPKADPKLSRNASNPPELRAYASQPVLGQPKTLRTISISNVFSPTPNTPQKIPLNPEIKVPKGFFDSMVVEQNRFPHSEQPSSPTPLSLPNKEDLKGKNSSTFFDIDLPKTSESFKPSARLSSTPDKKTSLNNLFFTETDELARSPTPNERNYSLMNSKISFFTASDFQ